MIDSIRDKTSQRPRDSVDRSKTPEHSSIIDDPASLAECDANRSGYYRYQRGKGIVFVPYGARRLGKR